MDRLPESRLRTFSSSEVEIAAVEVDSVDDDTIGRDDGAGETLEVSVAVFAAK